MAGVIYDFINNGVAGLPRTFVSDRTSMFIDDCFASNIALNRSDYRCVNQGGIVDSTVRELVADTNVRPLSNPCLSVRYLVEISTASTRLLAVRPTSVRLLATGARNPTPSADSCSPDTPCTSIKRVRTELARRLDRAILPSRLPSASVCPTSAMRRCAFCFRYCENLFQ